MPSSFGSELCSNTIIGWGWLDSYHLYIIVNQMSLGFKTGPMGGVCVRACRDPLWNGNCMKMLKEKSYHTSHYHINRQADNPYGDRIFPDHSICNLQLDDADLSVIVLTNNPFSKAALRWNRTSFFLAFWKQVWKVAKHSENIL